VGSVVNFRGVALVALVLLTGACASTDDVRSVRMELRTLAVRQDSAFRALMRAVARGNEATLDSVSAVAEELFAFRGDANNRLVAIREQQLRLGELVGQSQRSLQNLQDEVTAQRLEMQQWDSRVPAVDEESATEGEGTGETDLDPAESAVNEEGTDPAEEVYQAAVRSLERGNFGMARRGFEHFVGEFPNHELTPMAYVSLGALASDGNDLEEAIEFYLRVPELFPDAEAVPDALFRTGVLYLELEDCDLAAEYLERVVNSYAEHRLAARAQERLEECS